jgi:DMSO/TMAO reductase YedYZ molybdopterin-dependent catalytic subunit
MRSAAASERDGWRVSITQEWRHIMSDGRKFVTTTPENSETPLEAARSWVTPNRLFFVRNHFSEPQIDVAQWQLTLDGLVSRPRQWTYDELCDMPERTVFATVECAGNGRSFLQEKVPGVQWGAGAIGHAEWTGVPLRTLLEECGLNPEVIEIRFEGADCGSESDHPDPMNFARSLPLAKAMHPDTLLALRMNGETLEPRHGYPVRLFVPGWYGVASVKWLTRISAIDHAFAGYFQSKKYTYKRRNPSGTETVVVGPMRVKSEVIRPRENETLGVGTNRVFGVAWAGEEPVASVDVSTDEGRTWNPAQLIGPKAAYSWTMWEYLWEVATPGSYSVMARASSWSGQVQPATYDPLYSTYMIHFSRPTSVRVELSRKGAPQMPDPNAYLYDMNAYAEDNKRMPLDAEMEFAIGAGI